MPRRKERAAGYPRVSDEGLKDSKTLESQEKEIRRYIAVNEYNLLEEHMYPEAMTAYYRPFRERPQLMKLLDAARRHEFDVVVVTEFGRLSRRQVEQAVIIGLLESYNVRVESCTEKFEDSAIGHFMRAVYAFTSELEREKIMYRMTRGMRDRVEDGNLTGRGVPTYGYMWLDTDDYRKARYELNCKVIVVDQDGTAWTEVKVVEYIFDLAKKGTSVRTIALTLTRMGIPTQRGKAYWSYATVHQILTNRMYTGQAAAFRYNKEGRKSAIIRPEEEHIQLPEGVVPTIIDSETFEEVQEQLRLNKEQSLRNNKHPKNTGLLRAGFAYCGICKHVMHVRHHNKAYSGRKTPNKDEYFCCINRGVEDLLHHHCISINLQLLDENGWKVAVRYIRNPAMLEQQVEALLKELREARKGTTETAESVENGLAEIDQQMQNLYTLAKAARQDKTINDLAAQLQDLERQRRDIERMRSTLEEEEEVHQKIQMEITQFESWAKRVRADLDDPTFQPTYEHMRKAVRILGIKAIVYPGDTLERVKIEVRPPSIMSLISESR